ncbi:serine/threonine protein kinase [Sphaerisporangium dianthi]|uniref:Protein kinase n=1 Tax=Sphaerisporangium dianthi TaxID=1436120 RepID=A0ABV9CDH1_9ACTN
MTTNHLPLLRGDPSHVGAFRVLGRLGQGGQGVVYLGETPEGERVAIKVLARGLDQENQEGFRTEIELTRRVKAFCTAAVLATGEVDGVPYIVSEYVDGPSLASVLAERGPLRPAELRRLAIGTLTALAAIHQAGVVHRDLKPGNVLLAREGPRVIDFGISRALDSGEPTEEFLVGTPPYMAPEQFSGAGGGPPADLFAWAATVVCAATGRPPFGSGDLPVVVNRILSAEPELGDLRGDLRDLVASCLAKDPATRPTAPRALLTLLGHRVPSQRLLAVGSASAAPPATATEDTAPPAPSSATAPHRRRGRRPLMLVGAGAAAVSLAAAAAAWGLIGAGAPSTGRDGEARRTGASGPAADPSATSTAPDGPMPATSTTTVKIPGTKITLHENPADPVWAGSAYGNLRSGGDSPVYVRDQKTGDFTYFGNFQRAVVSPYGRYVASVSNTNFTRTDYNTIRLVDRVTKEDVELRAADKPGNIGVTRWSADGRRVVMTLYDDRAAEGNPATGFVIVDARAKSVETRLVSDGGKDDYTWGPGGSTLMHQGQGGVIRFLAPDGSVVRSFRDKGTLLASDAVTLRTGATVFATTCPRAPKDVCLWDAGSGAAHSVIHLRPDMTFNGWLDDRHFLATVKKGGTTRLVLAGLDGRAERVLADGPAEHLREITIWYAHR